MDDRRVGRLGSGLGHGGEPYPGGPGPARRRVAAWPLAVPAVLAVLAVLCLLLLAPPSASAAPRPKEIRADGRWHRFEVRSPEEVLTYLFEVTAGCRYRLVVECRTLPRALVEVGPGDATAWRADSRPPDDDPAPADPPERPEAVVTFDAELDGVLEARVRGFSAMTGKGRVRLLTLGPDGARVEPHRRMLAAGGTLARVGSLGVGEPNRWELVVEPGRLYEVRSRPGTAGRIALEVLGPGDVVLAAAPPTPDAPYPRLRFRAPTPGEEAEGGAPVLVVSAVDGGGGTYGVRLHEDPDATGTGEAGAAAPEPVETARLERPRLAFTANPGDVAVLYLPRASPYDPHPIQAQRGERWVTLSRDAVSVDGERASMRTPEKTALVWFRPYRPGTYRFVTRRPDEAVLLLYAADEVPAAPLLLGTGLDPAVRATGTPTWRTIGVGVCMPGWDYLFVGVRRRRATVSLRVRDARGDVEALRPKRWGGETRVAGLGPSLRFRVKKPTLVRLEARGRSWVGHALLRRAAN